MPFTTSPRQYSFTASLIINAKYVESVGGVNVTPTKVNVVGNTIVVSTENPLSVMQNSLTTEN